MVMVVIMVGVMLLQVAKGRGDRKGMWRACVTTSNVLNGAKQDMVFFIIEGRVSLNLSILLEYDP